MAHVAECIAAVIHYPLCVLCIGLLSILYAADGVWCWFCSKVSTLKWWDSHGQQRSTLAMTIILAQLVVSCILVSCQAFSYRPVLCICIFFACNGWLRSVSQCLKTITTLWWMVHTACSVHGNQHSHEVYMGWMMPHAGCVCVRCHWHSLLMQLIAPAAAICVCTLIMEFLFCKGLEQLVPF